MEISFRSKQLDINLAGALFLIAGFVAFMCIITAETQYPGYHTGEMMISDLGSTEEGFRVQPSSFIFSTSMVITGLLVIGGSYLLYKAAQPKLVVICIALFGIGALGVGIFDGGTGPHPLFAMLTFVAGAVSAIVTYKIENVPMKYISIGLGVISLSALLIYFLFQDSGFVTELGVGGIERWVAYPVIIWVMGFGGFLMGRSAAWGK